jgi:hypothetical protein
VHSWFRQNFGEKDTESLNYRFRNFMSAAEAVPLDGKTGLTQGVAETFRSNIGQDFVMHAVALKYREAFPLRQERTPYRLRYQIAGELYESRIGTICVEQRIAREHGALRESS